LSPHAEKRQAALAAESGLPTAVGVQNPVSADKETSFIMGPTLNFFGSMSASRAASPQSVLAAQRSSAPEQRQAVDHDH
jgi:hypothetical protein